MRLRRRADFSRNLRDLRLFCRFVGFGHLCDAHVSTNRNLTADKDALTGWITEKKRMANLIGRLLQIALLCAAIVRSDLRF